MDLLEKGLLAKNFGMLGLGDIVVPGIYIALLCRFDNEWELLYCTHTYMYMYMCKMCMYIMQYAVWLGVPVLYIIVTVPKLKLNLVLMVDV